MNIVAAAFLGLTAAGSAAILALPPDAGKRASLGIGLGQAALLVLYSVGALAGRASPIALWAIPGWGLMTLHLSVFAAFFTLLEAIVYGAVFVFSPGYLTHAGTPRRVKVYLVVLHLLMAVIALVLAAGDVVSFLVLWEVMSILAYLLVLFRETDVAASRAAYLMFGASEAGFLAVVAAFVPLALHAHGISFGTIARSTRVHPLAPGLSDAVFLLSLFGFGVKTGLFPTMSWLPRAHPEAPANGSAVLSGIILNLGVYGIVLTAVVLNPVPELWRGLLILVLGSITALVGVLYAATDTHLKRLLAHSSVENLGLVLTALGAALTFEAARLPLLAGIGWIACLYQLLNHSMYKPLLFLGAGSIDIATGSLDADHLGGLGRTMRWTSLFMLAGALAIAALPPLNGFVSEWLILQTLLRSVSLHHPLPEALFALSGVLVALTAGLSVTAFVRFYGMTFLGRPRSVAAAQARDPAPSLRWAMGLLVLLCLFLGLAPTYVAAGLGRIAGSITGAPSSRALIPPFFNPGHVLLPAFVAQFHALGAQIGGAILPAPGLVFLHQTVKGGAHVVFAMAPTYLAVALCVAIVLTALAVRYLGGRMAVLHKPDWTGGISHLPATAFYTATGFATPIRAIFRVVLNPSRPLDVEERLSNHFPSSIRREVDDVYAVDRWFVNPASRLVRAVAHFLARLHRGSVNAYVAYVLATLLLVLLVVRLG